METCGLMGFYETLWDLPSRIIWQSSPGIENDHRKNGFTHETLPFSIAMLNSLLNDQEVPNMEDPMFGPILI